MTMNGYHGNGNIRMGWPMSRFASGLRAIIILLTAIVLIRTRARYVGQQGFIRYLICTVSSNRDFYEGV
jgi:hypothetical protein